MKEHDAFLAFVKEDFEQLPETSLSELVGETGSKSRFFIVFVDILKGFCETGALASSRVNEMVAPVARLAEEAKNMGIPPENFIFLHDAHPEDAKEFRVFAPHCVRKTTEAELVHALKPYLTDPEYQLFHKNATNGLFGRNGNGTLFHEWLKETFAQGPATFLVVGDCTDLCIYQNAMAIQLFAYEHQEEAKVIVSKNHVRTYDMPLDQAQTLGALPHDADWLERIFMYHMKLNGIKTVSLK